MSCHHCGISLQHIFLDFGFALSSKVYLDADALWCAIEEHRSGKKRVPLFGRFSEMMDLFDPFRDGRAAERMGTYLKWVLEGYDAGLTKDQVLADANQRYCDQWGADKIVPGINC